MKTADFLHLLLEENSIKELQKLYPEFSLKQIESFLKEAAECLENRTEPPPSIKVYVDGASKGNPGEAGIGYLIIDANGKTVKEFSRHIGKTTNNVAEYTALIEALKECDRLGIKNVHVFSDSELVVKQMNGLYAAKQKHIGELLKKAKEIARQFDSFRITHIPRTENRKADALASSAAFKHATE